MKRKGLFVNVTTKVKNYTVDNVIAYNNKTIRNMHLHLAT